MNKITGNKMTLYPFQNEIINKMYEREKKKKYLRDNININSDTSFITTKTGKSTIVINYIKNQYENDKLWMTHNNEKLDKTQQNKYTDNIFIEEKIILYKKFSTIVVTNKNNVSHWDNICKDNNINSIILRKHKFNEILLSNLDKNVIIISNDVYNSLSDISNKMSIVWKRIIIDKPSTMDRLDNWNNIYYDYLWFIIDSPTALFHKYRLKKRTNWIMNILKKPNRNNFIHIDNLLYIIDMLSISNLFSDENIPSLPIKNITYKCNFQTIQNTQHYARFMLHNFPISINNYDNVTTPCLKTILKEKKKDSENYNLCSICHSEQEYPVMETSCCNIFCSKCLLTWMLHKNTCPICRTNISSSNLIYEYKQNIEHVNVRQSRQQVINNIVRKHKRTIVFSRENIISKFNIDSNHKKIITFTDKNLYYSYNTFINSDSYVAFLTPKCIMYRINLQSCDNIIIYGDTSIKDENRLKKLVTNISKKNTTVFHQMYDC